MPVDGERSFHFPTVHPPSLVHHPTHPVASSFLEEIEEERQLIRQLFLFIAKRFFVFI